MRKRKLLYMLISLSCAITISRDVHNNQWLLSVKKAKAIKYEQSANINISSNNHSIQQLMKNYQGTISKLVTEAINEVSKIYNKDEILKRIAKDNIIKSDYIEFNEKRIPLAYGDATQQMVDKYDVVEDTGFTKNTSNIFIFGHNTRSFGMLDLVNVGDVIKLDNNGTTCKFEVERNEIGILTPKETDIEFLSDGENVVLKDYGYKTLILITCAKGYEWNYRRVVIAKEMN